MVGMLDDGVDREVFICVMIVMFLVLILLFMLLIVTRNDAFEV